MSVTFIAATFDGPAVNLANDNAAQLLALLGFTNPERALWEDGPLPAADFLGRVLLALGLVDAATDQEGRPEVMDGNWVRCGTTPGYLAGRLTELYDVALWALDHHATVTWG